MRKSGAGANVDQAEKDGAKPLYIAAQNGRAEVVNVLIKAGANVNKAEKDGATPLYIAAQNGHAEVVEALIKAGANVDKANNNGNTPLHIAVANGHAEVVKALIEAGANVDQANKNGAKPLTTAVSNGHTEVVQALLNAGADVDKAEKNGATPLDIAKSNSHTAILKILQEKIKLEKYFDKNLPEKYKGSVCVSSKTQENGKLYPCITPRRGKEEVFKELIQNSYVSESNLFVNKLRILAQANITEHDQGKSVTFQMTSEELLNKNLERRYFTCIIACGRALTSGAHRAVSHGR